MVKNNIPKPQMRKYKKKVSKLKKSKKFLKIMTDRVGDSENDDDFS